MSAREPAYDLVGDVHGCASELDTLLAKLGWDGVTHPEGRVAVFVGDLVDRHQPRPSAASMRSMMRRAHMPPMSMLRL